MNGTDYTVSYENNLNVTDEKNPAYVIIKGTGNYGGQVRTAFAITAKNIGRYTQVRRLSLRSQSEMAQGYWRPERIMTLLTATTQM